MASSYYYSFILASTYGSNAYNTDVYNGSSASSGSGSLTNTGIAIAVVVTAAALILLTAMMVRIWHRPSKKAAAQSGVSNSANE